MFQILNIQFIYCGCGLGHTKLDFSFYLLPASPCWQQACPLLLTYFHQENELPICVFLKRMMDRKVKSNLGRLYDEKCLRKF